MAFFYKKVYFYSFFNRYFLLFWVFLLLLQPKFYKLLTI